jgi:flavin-binding protein dodecin
MNIKEHYYQFRNFYETIKFYKYRIRKRSEYFELKQNNKFKNKHIGKRCFVLGNGPSLKNQDLSLLSEEYVFTVNQIMRHQDFDKIKTNYHFWADPMFFKIDEKNIKDFELLQVMKNVNSLDNKPNCFFPIEQKEFVEKFGLNNTLNINYFRSKETFHDKYTKEIDFAKNIPGFHTVVQWAIIMAIYMGFKEIYLLGCDNTSITVTINSALKENSDADYAYAITEIEKQRMENLLNDHTLEEYCNSYSATLAGYRRLYKYCLERNIELINCSAKTVIDSIPKEKYENVIKRVKNEQIKP